MAFEMYAYAKDGQVLVSFVNDGVTLKTLQYSPDGAEAMAGIMRTKILEAVAQARQQKAPAPSRS